MNGLERIAAGAADAFEFLGRPAVYGIALFLLALVFLLSAYPKFRKPRLAALAIVDFGVMKEVRTEAGLGLALVELILAVALILSVVVGGAAAIAVAALAAVLLWTFVVLIARALRSPERFSCFCFGSDAGLSAWTLTRSTLLALLATALAFAGGDYGAPTVSEFVLELTTATAILGTVGLVVSAPAIWRENQ